MRRRPLQNCIEIRDTATGKLVCRFDPHTREIEVVIRRDIRRGVLPQDMERIQVYAALTKEEA